MCIINKYANIYLQKIYIVMSCLRDFLKLKIADRPRANSGVSDRVITSEQHVCLVSGSVEENDLWHAVTLHLRRPDNHRSV